MFCLKIILFFYEWPNWLYHMVISMVNIAKIIENLIRNIRFIANRRFLPCYAILKFFLWIWISFKPWNYYINSKWRVGGVFILIHWDSFKLYFPTILMRYGYKLTTQQWFLYIMSYVVPNASRHHLTFTARLIVILLHWQFLNIISFWLFFSNYFYLFSNNIRRINSWGLILQNDYLVFKYFLIFNMKTL